ncbi:MAG: DUF1211 domain-containing protein [Williamsia sp.]|nr:DUF1211 domain-containing protein [Williamsia sp.]
MKITTGRLEAFSDGVIAIIITIMILELKLPDLNRHSSEAHMISYLKSLAPYFSIYVFSYTMIGIFWTNHHHMFHLLETTDETLLWLNFVFLFALSLIPFATAIVGASPLLSLSAAIYGFVLLLTTLSFLVMRNYTIRHKLLHEDNDRTLSRKIYRLSLRARTKSLVGAIVYLAAIGTAYINIYVAYIGFLIPAVIFFLPEGIDGERLSEIVAEEK